MKKSLDLIVWLAMGLILIGLVFVFIWQQQLNSGIRKELEAKKEELSNAQSASRKMEELEKKGQELKQKENKMKKRVAVGDIQPLELIRTITGLASKIGLRKIKFELKSSSANVSKDKKALPTPAPGAGPAPVYFQMKFNSTFPQALKLLEDLNGLERIVTVEKIEINREIGILPYQSVTLDLVTYSFPE